jgi:hypothetical protein
MGMRLLVLPQTFNHSENSTDGNGSHAEGLSSYFSSLKRCFRFIKKARMNVLAAFHRFQEGEKGLAKDSRCPPSL